MAKPSASQGQALEETRRRESDKVAASLSLQWRVWVEQPDLDPQLTRKIRRLGGAPGPLENLRAASTAAGRALSFLMILPCEDFYRTAGYHLEKFGVPYEP
jgi:hypothetical protein